MSIGKIYVILYAMPLSPELRRLPGIAASFYRAGILNELVTGMIKGETGRSLVEDARKLLWELETKTKVNFSGFENISKDTGCLIVFNHPNMDVLLPAMLELFVQIYDVNGQQVKLAMGSEIPMMTANFNEKISLPGSVILLKRFHRLYSENIISVPTAGNRKDFLTGRAVAVRKMMRAFKEGDIVVVSPEGHVEKGGSISPAETYHDGSGKLAILASKMGIPTVPVAVWEETPKMVEVVVGKPFFITTEEASLASTEAMYEVSKYMPKELRGPFNY